MNNMTTDNDLDLYDCLMNLKYNMRFIDTDTQNNIG